MPLFRSLRSRLVFYFLGLVSMVQIGVFLALDASNTRAARHKVNSMLDEGVGQVRRAIEARPDFLNRLVSNAPGAGGTLETRAAEELLQTTKLETSFAVRVTPERYQVGASTLPAMRRAALNSAIARGSLPTGQTVSLDMFGEEFLSRLVPLGGGEAAVVLQYSLAREEEAFLDAQRTVLFLSWGGLILSAFGAMFVARTVTEPMRELAEAARNIGKGNYAAPPRSWEKSELGELASAFGDMAQGLAQRDRVRSVLGKVVSPEIAAQVLAEKVELAGAELPVTILFSDLRGFQAVGGPYGPRETLEILNVYLTRMTAVVERHHGVVDKYLGAGVMALFGAPVAQADDAGDALDAALAMLHDLDELNEELARNALPRLDMGIGIHSATVLAGNIGSAKRLGYTVIGDGVGYAARLEGLTAHGNVSARILASAATVRRAKRKFKVRPLAATAAGGNEPDLIFAVVGREDETAAQRQDAIPT